MRNSVLRAVLVGAAVVGLVAGGAPARAVSIEWEDPAGDAVFSVYGNDPAFDITAVKLSNDGGAFTWEVAVPELASGTPTLSTGYSFRLLFTHGDVNFRVQVAENVLGEQSGNIAVVGGTVPAAPLECEGCEGKIDRETKTVVFNAPLASLDKALQSAEAPPLAGHEWDGLSVVSYRQFAAPNPAGALPASGLVSPMDTADPPEGTTLPF